MTKPREMPAGPSQKGTRRVPGVAGPAAPAGARRASPALLRGLTEEHRSIGRLLVILEQQVQAVRDGNRADFGVVRTIMEYMTRYPDRHHHPREDLILDRIDAANPEMADITSELRRSHESFARKGQDLIGQLQGDLRSLNRARVDRLEEMLVDYIVLLRRHMHYEETIVFDEASRRLRKADWKDIEAAIPRVDDPIFGETTAPEFQALRARYLNRATSVATGLVPVGLFEIGASTAERIAHTGTLVRKLPSRMLQHARIRAGDQQRRLAALARSRSLDGAMEQLKTLGSACAKGPSEYAALVRSAVQGLEHDVAADAVSAAAAELATEERAYRVNNAAGVSWQAAALNVMLRSTIKRAFTSMDTSTAKRLAAFTARTRRAPDGIRLIKVPNKPFHAEWVRPIGAREIPRRTILYLPGGGFILPATTMHIAMLGRLARLAKARGLMVHYRLAPDHPFPAGLNDAVAAYRYLLDTGVSPKDIVIAGDSAGGCLTLSLLLALRQQNLPMPAGGAILSALSDLNFVAPSRTYNKWRDPMLPTGSSSGFFEFYARNASKDDPLVSPIYGDYHGFPPMFAQVGSTEILIDDTLLIARKARAQGVEFDVEVWEGMPHVWQMAQFLPESRRALVRIATFLEKAWYKAHNPKSVRRRRVAAEKSAA